MIKRTVHIDLNYPRRFSEQASVDGPSKTNWGFNTTGDELNGNVVTESPDKITNSEINDSTYVDQLYDNTNITGNKRKLATAQQYAALNNDKQMRFNANVFNYIVHTEIDNIILKYDSPVVYAVENWQDKVICIYGMPYHIMFNILLHDPMGLDMYAYEAWLGDQKFTHQDRKHDPNDEDQITPVSQITYAKFEDIHKLMPGESGDLPTTGKWISLYNDAAYERHFTMTKLPDPYEEADKDNETAFRIAMHLGGMSYDTEDVNTDDALFATWQEINENPEATEQEIIDAWNACNGIKFKFFDVAGNVVYWVMPHLEIEIMTLDELYNMKKLILTFVNTNPEDMQLGTDLIGRTTVRVVNPNAKICNYPITIWLDDKSIGTLYQSTYRDQLVYDAYNSQNPLMKIATEDVGNIDESGWVIAHATVDITSFIDELASFRQMMRNILQADGSLGEWIKECLDNLRKITLDPFVSQYLKETTDKKNAYYKFVKFTEKYLNTMYKAYDKNCYISILEMIARISNFNDCSLIYKNLLDKYDDDHGDMLHITLDELQSIISAQKEAPYDDKT